MPAPRPAVYGALTDPRRLAKWWSPHGFTAPSLEFNPRIGRSCRIAMQPSDRDLFYLSGEFRQIDRPARLTFTFRWDPPIPTIATRWPASLQDRGARTEVLLTQREFTTPGASGAARTGWTESFERLGERVREAAR